MLDKKKFPSHQVANFHPQKNHLWGTHGSNLNKLLLEQQREKKKHELVRHVLNMAWPSGPKPLVSDKETRGEDKERREKISNKQKRERESEREKRKEKA